MFDLQRITQIKHRSPVEPNAIVLQTVISNPRAAIDDGYLPTKESESHARVESSQLNTSLPYLHEGPYE